MASATSAFDAWCRPTSGVRTSRSPRAVRATKRVSSAVTVTSLSAASSYTARTGVAPCPWACATSSARMSASGSPTMAGTPGLKIPAFSKAISSPRGPQVLDMIDLDVGHAGHEGRQHVGGIQPAAEARLDHGDVNAGLGKELEGHRRRRLEERGAEPLDVGSPAVDPLDDPLARDGDAVNQKPLGKN